MRRLILALLPFVSTIPIAVADPASWKPASWNHLPHWHGTNLLHRFHRDWQNKPFTEPDIALLAEFGFDFARLPMDYRVYIRNGDWLQFDEAVLKNLDDTIAWGIAHHVHIQLCLHRIPGFTVASPAEATSLWVDANAQAAAAAHWSMFAKRYKGIPNEQLSFNLFNEPTGATASQYFAIVSLLADAIRAEDAERLIVADGLDYGATPVPELIPLQVAQSFHMYEPFNLTHYRASWVEGSDTWAEPSWPGNKVSSYLFGPDKQDLQGALVINGDFGAETTLRIRINVVSARSRLVVKADGASVYERAFQPGPGVGEWMTVVFRPEWGIYQNVYQRDYYATIPAGTKSVSIANTDGDWMTLSAIGLAPAGEAERSFSPGNESYGSLQSQPVTYRPQDPERPFDFGDESGRKRIWDLRVAEWVALREQGVGIMAGEWGVHNQTSHATTLAWTRDMLEIMTAQNIGWAQWDFFGSFGPFDSGRPDVEYEPYQGRLLDRRMMDLMQEYILQRESYQRWSERVFRNSNVPLERQSPAAFAFASGLSNLSCYFHDIDPVRPDFEALPSIVPGNPSALRFRLSPRLVSTSARALLSSNLHDWTELTTPLQVNGATATLALPQSEVRSFIRLAISLTP